VHAWTQMAMRLKGSKFRFADVIGLEVRADERYRGSARNHRKVGGRVMARPVRKSGSRRRTTGSTTGSRMTHASSRASRKPGRACAQGKAFGWRIWSADQNFAATTIEVAINDLEPEGRFPTETRACEASS